MPKYLITTGSRDKIDRIHRTTCARAIKAGGVERNLTEPGGRTLATCCKPLFDSATPQKATGAAKATGAKKATPTTGKPTTKKAPAKKATTAKKATPTKKAPAKRAPAKAPEIPDVANAREAVAAGADPHPVRRGELADIETKAKKLARGAGEPIPPTPNADFVAKEYADGVDAAARKRLGREYDDALAGMTPRRGRPAQTVRYYRNGKAMPDSQNRFSSVAYWFTRDVGRERPRMPTKEFRALVQAECGVTDVDREAWTITLSNGETIEAKIEQTS